jgi:acetyl/propionyl-CoA carboxylase alpha subunit
MKYYVALDGQTVEVDLRGQHPLLDGSPVDIELTTIAGTPVRHLRIGSTNRSIVAQAGARPGSWVVHVDGRAVEVEVVDERTRAIRAMTGASQAEAPKHIVAPMPGLVVRVNVVVGQPVTAGQGLIVVEAMKMENELKATSDGTVTRIDVAPGDAVEKGALLIALE